MLRGRQFNVRLTDEEAATLDLLARRSGVTPSELLRHFIREAADQSAPPQLSELHRDLLTAMTRDRDTPKTVIDLLNLVAHKHDHPWLGNAVANSLAELERLGHVDRTPHSGRAYLITVSGIDIAKKRR